MFEQSFETANPTNHRLKLNGDVIGYWGFAPYSTNELDWTVEPYVNHASVAVTVVPSEGLYNAYIGRGYTSELASSLSGFIP